MFKLPVEDRLTEWLNHRQHLEDTKDPITEVWDFWSSAPFIPYNRNVDPYNQKSWPTPWEIIVENQYDDFTKALMIAWTLKLTNRFKKSKIELHTLVDNAQTREYNSIIIDDTWAINFDDAGPILVKDIPNSFRLENLVEVASPR